MHKCFKDLNLEEIRCNPRQFIKRLIFLALNTFTYKIRVKKKKNKSILLFYIIIPTVLILSRDIELKTLNIYTCANQPQ